MTTDDSVTTFVINFCFEFHSHTHLVYGPRGSSGSKANMSKQKRKLDIEEPVSSKMKWVMFPPIKHALCWLLLQGVWWICLACLISAGSVWLHVMWWGRTSWLAGVWGINGNGIGTSFWSWCFILSVCVCVLTGDLRLSYLLYIQLCATYVATCGSIQHHEVIWQHWQCCRSTGMVHHDKIMPITMNLRVH